MTKIKANQSGKLAAPAQEEARKADVAGKTTIVKQMKIIHQNGYKPSELEAFRPLIWKNLLESGQDVINGLTKVGLECTEPTNKVRLVLRLLSVLATSSHLLPPIYPPPPPRATTNTEDTDFSGRCVRRLCVHVCLHRATSS